MKRYVFWTESYCLSKQPGNKFLTLSTSWALLQNYGVQKILRIFSPAWDRAQQQEWIDDALEHLTPPSEDAPRICILDTGVNEQHPLLQSATDTADMHTYNPAWGTDDRYGHGTPMAGLAIYGDLTVPLASTGPIELTHRLESVKVIPNPGSHTDKLLYGAITRESINRVEVNPDSQRVYAMAVSATDDRDHGKPSSWSASIDALSSGYDDEQYRLIILAAGNTDSQERHRHPHSNMTDAIHDPGQAWNALTIGAFTEKALLDTGKYPGWKPVAKLGDLAPLKLYINGMEQNLADQTGHRHGRRQYGNQSKLRHCRLH